MGKGEALQTILPCVLPLFCRFTLNPKVLLRTLSFVPCLICIATVSFLVVHVLLAGASCS